MTDVLNLSVNENKDSADILIYGYIGDHWEEKRKNSDQKFVEELARLEKKYDRINIRINSPGGSVYHGNAITNAIMSSDKEIHTYIDGMAASMGFMIWASAKHRHCSVSGVSMSHRPWNIALGNASELRKAADMLDTFESSLVGTLVHSLGMKEDEVKETFFGADDKWMDRKEMKELGLITEDDYYHSESKPPKDVENMTYFDIINHFKDQKDPGSVTLLKGLRERVLKTTKNITKAAAAVFTKKDVKDMNLEEFKNSLESGDLSAYEVRNHLESISDAQPENPAPDTPPAVENTAADLEKAISDAVAPLNEKIQTLTASLEKLNKAPGATPSSPEIPSDKLPEGVEDAAALAAFHESIADMKGEVRFTK